MRALALAPLLALLLAGCLGAPGPQGVAPAAAPPLQGPADLAALVAGLPCEAAEVGSATTENLLEVGLLDASPTPGRMGALDSHGTLLLFERYDAGGFVMVDVADPLQPRALATYEDDALAPTLDLKFSTDGSTALLAGLPGVVLVDVRDPRAPARMGAWEFPAGSPGNIQAHTLHLLPIGGRDVVFVGTQSGHGVHILELLGPPGAQRLELLTVWGDALDDPMGPHEAWAQLDEALGFPVLYTANGWLGWHAADVRDPANPRLLTLAPNLDPYQNYVHSVVAGHVDGRRLVVTTSEIGANAVRVYDATDLALPPRLLATWTSRPVPTPSEHFHQVVDGKLLLTHYQEGGYVFDLRALPAAPGLPWGPMARLVAGPDAGPTSSFPFTGWEGIYDVEVRDGLTYWADRRLGVRVVAFGCFEPGNPAHTGDA